MNTRIQAANVVQALLLIGSFLLFLTSGGLLLAGGNPPTAAASPPAASVKEGGEGPGLAARYPHDAGIEQDPDVVFTENFGEGSIQEIGKRWGSISNKNEKVMALSDDVPPGSASHHSLQMTATRGENEGGYLFKVFKTGYDQLFCRFYVKFGADHGFVHHFVKLQGSINPPPWPEGEAGHTHPNDFTTGIEPTEISALQYPFPHFPPPGIWHFYTYWPEMRSWQNENGTGTSYYGNDFEPQEPVLVPRGRWTCVEFVVRMNSSPEKSDGEQSFWIDGKPAGRFAPGTPVGNWIRDIFRIDSKTGQPFPGMRWRKQMEIKVNKLWLLYYITEKAFQMDDAYAAAHPGYPINTRSATVQFSDIVVSRAYIGPIK